MKKLLDKSYFLNRDVLDLSKDLLGKSIETIFNGRLTSGIIVETEAYRAPEDKGSHAFGNKRTKRTETMFKEGGIAYVYLCYGIHHLFNIVVGPEDTAHAILIRAIEPLDGIDIMERRREVKSIKQYGNGPGKLSAALGIKTINNGAPLNQETSQIKIYNLGNSYSADQIIESPRVGIAYADDWANKPWRFRLKDNSYTSSPKSVTY